MTQKRASQEEHYLAAFARLERDGFAGDPVWLRQLRKDAIGHFGRLGFPTARRGNEEWKYTDVAPIAQAVFETPTDGPAAYIPSEAFEAHAFAGAQRSRLVFANGGFVPELSSTESLPDGVTLCNLPQALSDPNGVASKHLGRYALCDKHAFTALNTAFVRDGGFLHVPDGVSVPGDIQLLFISTEAAEAGPRLVAHPRILVVLGRDAKATLIETHATVATGAAGAAGTHDVVASHFTNSVMEVILGPGASLDHYKLQDESSHGFHVATTQVDQQRDSRYAALSLDSGGGLVRNNLSVLLREEGASTLLTGLYLLSGLQHVDFNTFIDHAVPYTSAKELYKGVVSGQAHAVFGGKLLVRPHAQKTTSHQTNKTILLSEGASVDTKPQLEIYADDVKCGHGAAIGQLDQEALFYLKTRGLTDTGARNLLTYGFVSELLANVAHVPFRAYLETLVHARLHDMVAVEAAS